MDENMGLILFAGRLKSEQFLKLSVPLKIAYIISDVKRVAVTADANLVNVGFKIRPSDLIVLCIDAYKAMPSEIVVADYIATSKALLTGDDYEAYLYGIAADTFSSLRMLGLLDGPVLDMPAGSLQDGRGIGDSVQDFVELSVLLDQEQSVDDLTFVKRAVEQQKALHAAKVID